jgi:signal transduction histidine kinase
VPASSAIDRLRTLNRRAADGLLAALLAAALEAQLVLGEDPGASAVAVLAGLGLTLPLAWRRRAPVAVAVAFATIALVQAALGGDLFAGEPPVLPALAAGAATFYALGAHAADRVSPGAAAAGVLGLWATVVVSGHRDVMSFVFAGGLIALTPWLAGRAARARALRTAALERERDQGLRVAAGEERQRIARELHDVVAHGVVVMVIQAQGARRMLDHDPERAREALRAIEDTGRLALSEMRRSLGVLRLDDTAAELAPQPTLGDLDALIDEMRQAGLKVELAVEGVPRACSEGIDRSAYRIVQEALTNTLKHAGLVRTHVTVTYGADDLRLVIADDGPGPREPRDDGNPGHGIVGMRERVGLYGGELHARPENGHGFVVRARIPLSR